MPGTTAFDPGRAYSAQIEKRSGIGPIVWAIDPEAINSIEMARMLDFLTVWRGQRGAAAIVPVAVVPPHEPYGSLDITAAARKDLDQEARDCLQSALNYLSPNEELKAEVIESPGRGRSTFIQSLVEVAETHDAEFIAANTHVTPEEHGPFRVGSFCEGLIANAHIPVITINPRTVLPNEITKIFLMTDFSHEARELLFMAVGCARHHGAELVLFHQIEEPMPPANRVDPVFMTTERELAGAAIEHESELWLRYARRKHVGCRMIINEGPTTIEGAALRVAASEKPSVIVMGTRMGPVEQRILGSHAREVLVGAKTPVIVLHHRDM